MADPFFTSDRIIQSTTGTYTLSEAIERMKLADSLPTGKLAFNWVDAKTKNPVIIGYNNHANNIKL